MNFETWTAEEALTKTDAEKVQHYANLRQAATKNYVDWAARELPQYPEFWSKTDQEPGHRIENRLAELRYAGNVMSLLPKTGEVALGGLAKLGALAGVMDRAHLSEGMFQFRLANTSIGRVYIDHFHNYLEVLHEKPYLASGAGVAAAGALAATRTWENSKKNFPWVSANPDVARDISHIVTDPSMLGLFGGVKGIPMIAREIDALVPAVEGFKLAAGRSTMASALADTTVHGARLAAAPLASPEFVDAMRGMVKAGMSDRFIAEQIHMMNGRAKESIAHMLLGKLPDFFKSGEELYPQSERYIVEKAQSAVRAFNRQKEVIKASIPDFTPGEWRYTQEAMHYLDTNPSDLKGSFLQAHAQAMGKPVQILDAEGKATGMTWQAKHVSDGFMDRMLKVIELREEGLNAKVGTLSPIERNPSYGPSKGYAARVNSGDFKGALTQLEKEGEQYPGWRLHQKEAGFIEALEDGKNWLTKVVLREKEVAMQKELLPMIEERKAVLTEAILRNRPGSVAKELERLHTEISDLEDAVGNSGKVTLLAQKELSRNIRTLQQAEQFRIEMLKAERSTLQKEIAQHGEVIKGYEGKPLFSEGSAPVTDTPPVGIAAENAAIEKTLDDVTAQREKLWESLHGRIDMETGEQFEGLVDQFQNAQKANVDHELVNELVDKMRKGEERVRVLDDRIQGMKLKLSTPESARLPRGVGRDIQPGVNRDTPDWSTRGSDMDIERQLADDKRARVAKLDDFIKTSEKYVQDVGKRTAADFKQSWAKAEDTKRQALQNRLDHARERVKDISSNPDAIYREGNDRFNDPTPAETKLFNARARLDELKRDVLNLKRDHDPLHDLAEKDPTGAAMKVLKAWDYQNRLTFRMLTTWNPTVWFHETAGKHLLRMSAETGDISMKGVGRALWTGEGPRLKDPLGNIIEISSVQNDAMFQRMERGRMFEDGAWGRTKKIANSLQSFIEGRLNALDELYQIRLKSYHQNGKFNELVRAGVAEPTANKIAARYGEQQVSRVMGVYRTRPGAVAALSRIKPAGIHNLNFMSFWGAQALAHPPEAAIAIRAYGNYKKYSLDGDGMYKVPGYPLAVDAIRYIEPVKFYNKLPNLAQDLSDPDRREFRAWRVGNAILGEDGLLANEVLSRLGVAQPQSERSIGAVDEAVRMLNIAANNGDLQPSDAVFDAMGREPKETKEFRDIRSDAFYNGVAMIGKEGPLTDAEARSRTTTNKVVSSVAMHLGGGVKMMYAPIGTEEALGRMQKYNAAIEMAKGTPLEENIYKIRDADPELAPLFGAMRRSPQTVFEAKDEAYRKDAEGMDTEIQQRGKILMDELGNSKWGALMSFFSPRAAGATEITSPAGDKYDNSDPKSILRAAALAEEHKPKTLSTVSPGKFPATGLPIAIPEQSQQRKYVASLRVGEAPIPVPFGKDRDLAVLGKDHAVFAPIYKELTAGHGSLDSLAAQIDGMKPEYRKYAMDKLVQMGENGDKRALAVIDLYHHAKDDTHPYVGALTAEMKDNHRAITDKMRDLVLHSDPKVAEFLLNGDPAKVRDAMRSNQEFAPYGTEKGDVDVTAVKEAQIASRQLQGAGLRNWEDSQKQKFPEVDYWREQLKSAAYYNPEVTGDVLTAVQGAMKLGKLPDTFFHDMAEKDLPLLQRVAVASAMPEITDQLGSVMRHDTQTGQAVAIDIPALRFQMAHGHYEAFAAIDAGWVGKDLQNQLHYAMQTEPLPDSFLGKSLPFNFHDIQFDPEKIGQVFMAPFQHRMGMNSDNLAAAINDYDHPSSTYMPSVGVRTDAAQPEPTLAPNVAVANLKTGNLAAVDINYGVRSMAMSLKGIDMAIKPTSYSPALPVRTQPQAGLMGYWSSSSSEYNTLHDRWEAGGQVGVEPTRMASFASNLMFTPKGPKGEVMPSRLAISPMQIGSAVAGAGQIAGAFGAYEQGSDTANAFGGLGMAMSAYSVGSAGVTALMGQAAAAGAMGGPVGIGIGVAAVGLGVAFGLMGSKKSGGDQQRQQQFNEEANRINRERLELEQEKYKEQISQREIRDVRTRETDLVNAVKGGAAFNKPNVEPHLAAFLRRGTYASKVGLVDAVERELGSALKPRW